MIGASLVWAPTGPLLEYWHRQDYWTPDYLFPIQLGNWIFGLEDYLFTFAFAGISTGLFEGFVVRTKHTAHPQLTHVFCWGYVKLIGLAMGMLLLGAVTITVWELNSVHTAMLISVVLAFLMLIKRRALLPAAFKTACAIGALTWVSYWGFYLRLFPGLIQAWWKRDALFGIELLGVPIEEIMWAWSAAFFLGVAFRFCMENTNRRPASPSEIPPQLEIVDPWV